jgi:predicted Zn-dependent protease
MTDATDQHEELQRHVLANDFERAEALSRELIRRNANDVSAHKTLGQLLIRRGDVAAAISVLSHVLKLQPGSYVTLYSLANALLSLERVKESAAYFRLAAQHAPNPLERALMLAQAEAFARGFDDAATMLVS